MIGLPDETADAFEDHCVCSDVVSVCGSLTSRVNFDSAADSGEICTHRVGVTV